MDNRLNSFAHEFEEESDDIIMAFGELLEKEAARPKNMVRNSKKYAEVINAYKILREILEEQKQMTTGEGQCGAKYEITIKHIDWSYPNLGITVICDMFHVDPKFYDKFLEVVKTASNIAITPRITDELRIDFGFKNVFVEVGDDIPHNRIT